MKTNIFQSRESMLNGMSEGVVKVAQTPTESRDAPLPGSRKNYAMEVHNIHKAAPATGRRP